MLGQQSQLLKPHRAYHNRRRPHQYLGQHFPKISEKFLFKVQSLAMMYWAELSMIILALQPVARLLASSPHSG
jgi:hypothetical protein